LQVCRSVDTHGFTLLKASYDDPCAIPAPIAALGGAVTTNNTHLKRVT
jgi:hypothetical protein